MTKIKFELSKKQLDGAIKGVQGIAHPVRLMILYALSKEELSVNDLADFTGVSQSVTSQHLSKMKDNGILDSRKESNRVFYYVKDTKYRELVKSIIKLFSVQIKFLIQVRFLLGKPKENSNKPEQTYRQIKNQARSKTQFLVAQRLKQTYIGLHKQRKLVG